MSTAKVLSEVSPIREVSVHCKIWYIKEISLIFMSESIWRDETVIGLIQQRDNIQV